MACCFLCFPGDPIPGYARSDNPYTFHVRMLNTCIADPCCCLVAAGCPLCTACYLRYEALDRKLENYSCCQGYYPCLCIQPGKMGEESCPAVCLTVEACCFFTCAVQGTRHYLMDKYHIRPDPTDYQIIRCNNALQCLSCICNILACFIEDLREGARLLDHIAHLVFCTTQACMQVQSYDEIIFQRIKGVEAPVANTMKDRY